MSRDAGQRQTAWEVWIHFHQQMGEDPIGFIHQCGALGLLVVDDGTGFMERKDLDEVACPGCRHELARPETECSPIYGPRPS